MNNQEEGREGERSRARNLRQRNNRTAESEQPEREGGGLAGLQKG